MSNNSSDSDHEESDQVFDLTQLPASFQQFLEDNEIDSSIYTVSNLPRYFRLNTHFKGDLPSLDELRSQFGTSEVHKVHGIPNFYSVQLNSTTKRISDTTAYQQHAIFGIDLSSAIAVLALEIDKDDQVLDLCCAPGAKLCMISNMLGKMGLGTVTGVDLAGHRLATCRSLLRKYQVGEKVRLFEADGTTFSITPPTRLGNRMISEANKEKGTVKPFWASKMLRIQQESIQLYDKVLVDAECTHDGSIAHILKYQKWGWDQFEKNFMDPTRLNTISSLQRNLMKQGWKMLKAEGILIYSTCSLSKKQNEENVEWFLLHHKEAQLVPIPNIDISQAKIKSTDKQIIQCCQRFDPLNSNTSGFFIAKFIKLL